MTDTALVGGICVDIRKSMSRFADAYFKSSREFAAWIGMVPRQTGTGGRVQLHGISKRGDVYLRTLLIHGARAVMTHSKEKSDWLVSLQARRPKNVVTVALANKIARTVWALVANQTEYQPC